MSVTISTFYRNFTHQFGNLYTLAIESTATGDGSGGTISYNGTIASGVFKPEDVVYLRDLAIWQTDANTTFVNAQLIPYHWSAYLADKNVAAASSILHLAVAYGGSWYNDNANIWTLMPASTRMSNRERLLLGKPMNVDPQMLVTFSPNTNLKTYQFNLYFDVYRKA